MVKKELNVSEENVKHPPGDGNDAYGDLDAKESDADFSAEETVDTEE